MVPRSTEPRTSEPASHANACAAVGAAVLGATYGAVCLLPPATAAALTVEDGPIETVGALAFLGAAVVACSTATSARPGSRRRRWLAVMALGLIFCFGEELSWGQRIFGWQLPAVLHGANVQNETNLHNLWFLQGRTREGSNAPGLLAHLTLGRCFAAGCLVWGCLLPLWTRWRLPGSTALATGGPPLPPLAVGSLLAVNALTFRIALAVTSEPALVHPLNECKETTYAVLLLTAMTAIRLRDLQVPPGQVGGQ